MNYKKRKKLLIKSRVEKIYEDSIISTWTEDSVLGKVTEFVELSDDFIDRICNLIYEMIKEEKWANILKVYIGDFLLKNI